MEEEKNKHRINTGLVALDTVAKFNRINIDMNAVVREYGINTTDILPEELIRIAQREGFKVKLKKLKLNAIPEKYPMPAIVMLKDNTYMTLLALKKEENKVLVLPPLANHPLTINIEEFQNQSRNKSP